ncbi:cysteine hydrolase family protein [Sphingomonas morindae]|uniref:Isochorismatase family protein n=1 Tax=Sphingomonas morindae TaxID=1541170 RepID=A0ABY4XAD2_9SPHN|nr:isochorismatase family protein [Sphingomonas morindae]USI73655.1 isochorismatase family protein [Sphingomonas morindae]
MTTAWAIIDVQQDYFPGGALPLWRAIETEAAIVAAIADARAAGERILLVRHRNPADAALFAADSAGAALRPAVLAAAGPEAPIVTKSVADAFQGTDLARHLDGIDTLRLCGMMTQNCIVFTALSRATDGLRVQVAPDLCTAPTEQIHRIALRALASKVELVEG